MAKKNARAPYLRLAQPLVRDSGELRSATWAEALDRAAEGFRRNVERHGPDAFGMFSCARATNEMNFVAQKFARRGDRHQQRRLAATAPATPPASPVWRPPSAPAAAPRRTGRSRTPISSSCGAPTPA